MALVGLLYCRSALGPSSEAGDPSTEHMEAAHKEHDGDWRNTRKGGVGSRRECGFEFLGILMRETVMNIVCDDGTYKQCVDSNVFL